jgi:arsenite methyltransferase
LSTSVSQIAADPVFDRCWWIYSLCRERLFADHTETIATALQPLLRTHPHIRLLEVGCGPGFYSRRLAARFPYMQTMGVDTSERLLSHARLQAHRAKLENCHFLHADAHNLHSLEAADAVIASRLFLILAERDRVLSAIFQTLKPGGVFFIAEPTSALRTAVPLWLMRTVETFAGRAATSQTPVRCEVLGRGEFGQLIGGQPWSKVEIWHDKRYQYALCEKAS